MDEHITETSQEVFEGKVWAIMSYIGPLCFWALVKARENPFALFHAKQGLVIFLVQFVLWVFMFLPLIGPALFSIGSFILGIMSLLGLFNALNGNYYKLPFIGRLADEIVL